MGTSVLHIKSEVECRVFLFDEEKGIATPEKYFNLMVRKGEQELSFVGTSNNKLRCERSIPIEEADTDYKLELKKTDFYDFPSEFLELLNKAHQGEAEYQYEVGFSLCYGGCNVGGKIIHIDENIEKALYWLEKANAQNNLDARVLLGKVYLNDSRVVKDYRKAREYFVSVQNMTHEHYLDSYIADTFFFKKNYQEAINWYLSSSQNGYNSSNGVLGFCYFYGLGVQKNRGTALKYWKLAYKNDFDREYQFAWNIGICYWYGLGVNRNDEKAIDYFREASFNQADFEEWEVSYGENDTGLMRELKRVGGESAAEKGDAFAQFLLGLSYLRGDGCRQDVFLAWEWLAKAASQNERHALEIMGCEYLEGGLVEKDTRKGFELLFLSAKQKYWKAEHKIAQCYCNGVGVEKDYAKGLVWFWKVIRRNGYSQRKESIKPPKYLFFDTETTGLPDNENEPASNIDNWPRLVQLAWILTDENGECLSSNSVIIRPDGFSIPIEAVEVHGITTEKALKEGKPLQNVINAFLRDVRVAEYLVGHNVSFDQNIVGAELHRLGIDDVVSTAQSICTMKETVDLCAIKKHWDDDDIPELYGEVIDDEYDYPSLRDLYWELFEDEFDDAHDAMADTTACMKCFFELKKRGEIVHPISIEEAMAETANDD